ncbi:MAG: hypothetical protein IJO56_06400 [Oscillospiraceae bacterium]|nr:hypothetical protein [Oscillospiraceae bacterium]
MYDIIYEIIGHNWTTGDSAQQYIFFVCAALIIILTVVFIDMVYQVFSHFWSGKK